MLTEKKLKYLIADEKKAAAFYRKHGLYTLAKDESRHRRILLGKLKKHERGEK